MALEMKVHRDIAAYRARPLFNMTWRQLLAAAIMLLGGGGLFFLIASIYLIVHDAAWTDPEFGAATNLALFVVFPVLVPVAWWAWARPKGLNPETYAQFYIRYQIADKVITYADAGTDPAHRDEPVRDGSARRAAQEARKVEAAIARSVFEHPQDPAARRARKQAERGTRRRSR